MLDFGLRHRPSPLTLCFTCPVYLPLNTLDNARVLPQPLKEGLLGPEYLQRKIYTGPCQGKGTPASELFCLLFQVSLGEKVVDGGFGRSASCI
jgi:hypothetical protein